LTIQETLLALDVSSAIECFSYLNSAIVINMSKIVGEQEIDIEAVSQMSKKGNTATLSGGERSISTVILLIAIWYGTTSPFRCIDEFDVFMDANHKHMATRVR